MDINGNLKINLIGVSGKMYSGKNTVAKIINQLTNNKYEEKAFAGKLKQIASILTGISIEKFEDQEFKKQELDEEWWYYELYGSDYLQSYLDNKDEYDFDDLQKPTYRNLLQKLGTDCMRDNLHPNVWVNALFADLKVEWNGEYKNLKENLNIPNWIITDLRFPNEYDAIKDRKGICIRVNRDYVLRGAEEDPKKLHPSETALNNHTFDYEIDNNGSIEDLIEEVRKMLQHFKIIE